MTGTTIAQAIPIAISPILTRIYTPEDFGLVALFLAIASIFGSIASMSYELAIVVPDKDEDAINIFALGLIFTFIMSLILLILVVLFNDDLINILGNEEIGFWLYFVPVSVFFAGLFNILKYFNTRKKNYKDIANVTIAKSIILVVIQLSIGFIKQGATGLIAGNLASNVFSNVKLFKNILKDKVLISKISKEKIIAVAKKYKNFSKFSMPSAILNTASLQVPIILLGIFFNTAIVGFYSLSNKLVRMPIGVIGYSIGNVFYQKISNLKDNKEALKKLTLKTYKKLLQIGIFPFSTLVVFGDCIFSFVFGEQWIIAGEYVQVLALWMFVVFISSPLSNLCFILEKQKQAMYFNLTMFVINAFIISFGAFFFQDSYQTILIFGITGLLFWILWLTYLLKIVSIQVFPVILRTIIYTGLSISSLYIIRTLLC